MKKLNLDPRVLYVLFVLGAMMAAAGGPIIMGGGFSVP